MRGFEQLTWWGDYGQFADAADLCRIALVERAELADVVGIGRALVDRGIYLDRDGQHEAAIRCLRSALVLLPESEAHNRSATHQALGLAHVALQDFEAATRHADRAAAIVNVPAAFSIRIEWLRARIAAGCGNDSLAIGLYRQTIEALRRAPGDAALAACELCRVHLRAGDPGQAVTVARSAARFAFPKRQNRIVAAAIADLYRSAQCGAVSVRLLNRIIARVEHGLARRVPGKRR